MSSFMHDLKNLYVHRIVHSVENLWFSIKLNTSSRFQGSGQLNFRRAGRRELVTSTHSRYGTDPHHPGWSKSTKGQSQGMPKKHKDSFSSKSIRCNCQWPPAMSQMRTIMVPPLELSVAVTSARPKIFITVQKTLDGLYVPKFSPLVDAH